jgi:hypothetical protein
MLVALAAVIGASAAPVVAASPAPDRWETLRALDLRVASVAYKLLLANTQLCPKALAPQRGFVVHSIDQYDPADRQGAAHSFALGSRVSVMAVVASSAAQRSGLKSDDKLVSVNGRALNLGGASSGARPVGTAVAFAQNILAEEMAKGEVSLRISRDGQFHAVRFTADIGCAAEVELIAGGEVNAWADGKRIIVSDGIIAHCATDDDLALVIAHELAHNLLGHGAGPSPAGVRPHFSITGAPSAETREMEEEADRLRVRLASAAGFDLRGALSFLAALLSSNGAGNLAGTHPTSARRLALLSADIGRGARNSPVALVPTPRAQPGWSGTAAR